MALLIGLSVVILAQPAALAQEWWPMFRYDLSHTGHSPSAAPDTAIEAIHPPRRSYAGAFEEVLPRGQPPLVGYDLESARLYKGLEVAPELPLGRLHHPDRRHAIEEGTERGRVVPFRHDMVDRHPAGGLLQREPAQVRDVAVKRDARLALSDVLPRRKAWCHVEDAAKHV